jgi:hypothetical protein
LPPGASDPAHNVAAKCVPIVLPRRNGWQEIEMLKALILSTAILGAWLAAAPAPVPAAPAAATGFANTDGSAMQPGTRGPVIQL